MRVSLGEISIYESLLAVFLSRRNIGVNVPDVKKICILEDSFVTCVSNMVLVIFCYIESYVMNVLYGTTCGNI